MQVTPLEAIKLVYLVGPTDDNNTYYVQSVMRDSATGATIRTVNLTRNGRRFSGSLQAPADSTGRGRWIDITTTLYDDAGYSIKDTTYPEQVFSYVVQERISSALLAAGATAHGSSSGAEVDYKRIRQIMKDLLEVGVADIKNAMPEDAEPIEIPATDIGAIARAVTAALEPTHTGMASMLQKLLNALQSVENGLPGLIAGHQDFEPIFKRLEAVGMGHEEVVKALEPAILSIVEQILTKEFASFTQSASVYVPKLLQQHQPVREGGEGEGPREPGPSRTRSADQYHSAARALMGVAPKRK